MADDKYHDDHDHQLHPGHHDDHHQCVCGCSFHGNLRSLWCWSLDQNYTQRAHSVITFITIFQDRHISSSSSSSLSSSSSSATLSSSYIVTPLDFINLWVGLDLALKVNILTWQWQWLLDCYCCYCYGWKCWKGVVWKYIQTNRPSSKASEPSSRPRRRLTIGGSEEKYQESWFETETERQDVKHAEIRRELTVDGELPGVLNSTRDPTLLRYCCVLRPQSFILIQMVVVWIFTFCNLVEMFTFCIFEIWSIIKCL